jgi:signal transduction histidine kinase
VPEVDAVAAALDTTAQRLDELIARERSFSADASHQLRTPLAALRLELEGLELRDPGSEELAVALAQVERLQGTIETLLSVARDAPERDAEADLADLLDDLVARWNGPLAEGGRPLRAAVRAERPLAAAAPKVVAEVLDVLIANASRHGQGAVTVTAREVEGWLAVDVADEGEGFGDLGEEAFARRSAPGAGLGIGLSLARSLATAEGGALAVLHAGPEPVVRLILRRAAPRSGSSQVERVG